MTTQRTRSGLPEALEALRDGLIVSCQAYPGEAMRDPRVMTAVAQAVVEGGAAGIRAQGLADLRAIHAHLDVPLIGLVKTGSDGVFITPTVADALSVARAGAQIVALDGTRRPRPDGRPLAASIEAVHAAGALVMADCGCMEDALLSIEAGADCVGTTLAGYTGTRARSSGPDLALLADMVAGCTVPVIAEGRIRNPDDAALCLASGAFAVVVGTAITHPTSIARTFSDRLASLDQPGRKRW